MFGFFLIAGITAIVLFRISRSHREHMAMIEKNLYHPTLPKAPFRMNARSLFFGLLLSGFGAAGFLNLLLIGSCERGGYTFSLVTLFTGISLLVYWKITAPDRQYAKMLYDKAAQQYYE